MLSKVTIAALLAAVAFAQPPPQNGTVNGTAPIEPISDFLRVDCPEGCFKQQLSKNEWQCVCPVEAGEQLKKSAVEDCDDSIEICQQVKVVNVSPGFKYSAEAFRNWGVMAGTFLGYNTWLANPYNTSTDFNQAILYNFLWVFLTWGAQFFFWTQKALFKSEGGQIHGYFMKAVNFGTVNYALIYWLSDMLILRGILNDTATSKGSMWGKLAGLFFLQLVSVVIQINNKSSLEFDFKLANAAPTDFIESDYVPNSNELDEGSDLDAGFDAPPQPNQLQSDSNENDISAYWGF